MKEFAKSYLSEMATVKWWIGAVYWIVAFAVIARLVYGDWWWNA